MIELTLRRLDTVAPPTDHWHLMMSPVQDGHSPPGCSGFISELWEEVETHRPSLYVSIVSR